MLLFREITVTICGNNDGISYEPEIQCDSMTMH